MLLICQLPFYQCTTELVHAQKDMFVEKSKQSLVWSIILFTGSKVKVFTQQPPLTNWPKISTDWLCSLCRKESLLLMVDTTDICMCQNYIYLFININCLRLCLCSNLFSLLWPYLARSDKLKDLTVAQMWCGRIYDIVFVQKNLIL